MSFVRIVSTDPLAGLSVSAETLQKIKILIWRDPATDEILKSLSHEGKICPVIQLWRERLEHAS